MDQTDWQNGFQETEGQDQGDNREWDGVRKSRNVITGVTEEWGTEINGEDWWRLMSCIGLNYRSCYDKERPSLNSKKRIRERERSKRKPGKYTVYWSRLKVWKLKRCATKTLLEIKDVFSDRSNFCYCFKVFSQPAPNLSKFPWQYFIFMWINTRLMYN